MEQEKIEQLVKIFNSEPAVKLVYLFGSRVQDQAGPLSDYDLAIYLDPAATQKMFDLRFSLQAKISRLLQTDAIDLVILNSVQAPELKYQIISQGKLIFEREPFRVLVEPSILNQYFDFRDILRRHGLTAT